jgi:3-hydroxy-3-methylglutaryl CoA synthase
MTFDISSLAAGDTFEIEINDPRTGEPLLGEGGKACSVTVFGPGSKPFAAAQSAASNRAMKRLRSKGKIETTAEEDAASKATFLTAITQAFNNFSYKDGEQGPDMFRACYLDGAMGWLTDQVNTGAGDWANFTKAAPSS